MCHDVIKGNSHLDDLHGVYQKAIFFIPLQPDALDKTIVFLICIE
jgi:hypothetical protein